MLADDLQELEQVLVAQLDRFVYSKTLKALTDLHSARTPVSRSLKKLDFRIPNDYQSVKNSWKANKRKPVQQGIIFSDGSVMTASLVICEIPQLWRAGNLSPLKNVIVLLNRDNKPWAYIAEYNYCFYPNNDESPKARNLGYFRYDFHPSKMGDGNLGGHPNFHLHREFAEPQIDGEEPAGEIRLTTGLVHLSDVMSVCEQWLFPTMRKKRFVDYLKVGSFDDLAQDLTPGGSEKLIRGTYTKRQWKNFEKRKQFEAFVRNHGWNITLP